MIRCGWEPEFRIQESDRHIPDRFGETPPDHLYGRGHARPALSADLRCEVCPVVFVKLRLHLDQIRPGEALEVILKAGDQMKSVPRSVKGDGHRIVDVQRLDGGMFRLLIVKDGA